MQNDEAMNIPPSDNSDRFRAGDTARSNAPLDPQPLPTIVRDLHSLIQLGAKFSAIYADPPWPYSNTSARGAAQKHYKTMSMDAILKEPVNELAAEQSHLHLWTTNSFLREAFDVMQAWNFTYKSCLVWIKPQLGMGNYWRVSHEFLLLGVRGQLPFRDNTCRSWVSARRTIHSRKPFAFRALVEQVSPGPYLELYGREEQPNTQWTVYGNQVEQKLF